MLEREGTWRALLDEGGDRWLTLVAERGGGDLAGKIPGARGCTPQSCAFRDSARELADLGANVFGLSAQPLDELLFRL